MIGYLKLSKVAKDLNVTKATLWNWKHKGNINFTKIGSMNFISLNDYKRLMGIKDKQEELVVIYCRVSNSTNKNNLYTQKKRLIDYCNARGYKVYKVIEEYGSGINDKRPKLQKLLKDQDFTKIVIEHKDRLTRLGFNYIETLLNKNNKQIEVVNNVDTDKEDIIQDFVSIITSYCAKIYGKRRSNRKTEQLIKELNNDKI